MDPPITHRGRAVPIAPLCPSSLRKVLMSQLKAAAAVEGSAESRKSELGKYFILSNPPR